jgi:prevent-host-death family protein
MSSVTAFEAKTRFGELLERVARGEEIVITRHDKAVARIVPEGKRSISEVSKAVDALFELQRATKRDLRGRKVTDAEVRSAIDEGRL